MQILLAANLQPDSIVDGPGIRTVIWTQGCPHNCLACHNPSTHDFNGGELIDIKDIIDEFDTFENQDGVTFSGGDPMCQPDACLEIAKYIKNKGMNIWCYTGYLFEDLLKMSKNKNSIIEFLNLIDILIDGKFDLNLKSFNIKYRGSSNQRIIDVQKSLKADKVIEALEYKEQEKKVLSNMEVFI